MPKPLLATRVGHSSLPTRAMRLVTGDRTRVPDGAFIDIDKCSGTATVGLPTQSSARDGALL
jgi:hypothetical protein